MSTEHRYSGPKPTPGEVEGSADGTSAEPKDFPLRAEVYLLAERKWWSAVESATPEDVTLQRFTSPAEFCEELSGNTAVVIVSAALSADRISAVFRRTIQESEHARTVLLAADGAEILNCDVPHDAAYVLPDERDTFEDRLKHLYVRAYYSVAVRRYYRLGVSIQNRKQGDGADDDLETLEQARERVHEYLVAFRQFLDEADTEALSDRKERVRDLFAGSGRETDPSVAGLPGSCPDCGLDWSRWHGPRLRTGYESIGANTWRCTGCGHVMAGDDPDNYRVS